MDNKIYTIDIDYIEFHPGETLGEKIQELGMSATEFAEQAHLTERYVKRVIAQKAAVTPETAVAFEMVTKIPAYLWLKMQHDYDDFMLSQKKDSWIDRFLHFPRHAAAIL